MSFVSYAQNFEDLMLWRALKHLDRGFYIDVGANDPDVHSVTKAFYERGWHGINIEPIDEWFAKLECERQRDANLKVAAGASPGEIVFYEIPQTGLSTAFRDIAERHQRDSGFEFIERVVPVVPLREICLKHVNGPIHFLKVDVEGAERAVLEGMDFVSFRPWVVLVEATRPLLQDEDHGQWEVLLTDAGYDFVYFDGLNRFYVAREHPGLKSAFSSPPNVFDDFVTSAQSVNVEARKAADLRANEAEARALAAEARIQAAESLLHASEAKAQELAARIEAILKSSSWRVTAPVRAMREAVTKQSFFRGKAGDVLRNWRRPVRSLIVGSIRVVLRSPALAKRFRGFLQRFPALRGRLQALTASENLTDRAAFSGLRRSVMADSMPADISAMSPTERAIFLRLCAEVARANKESA